MRHGHHTLAGAEVFLGGSLNLLARDGLVFFVVLVGDTARGVSFPVLWPFVQSLGGDRRMQGYAVSAFSAASV